MYNSLGFTLLPRMRPILPSISLRNWVRLQSTVINSSSSSMTPLEESAALARKRQIIAKQSVQIYKPKPISPGLRWLRRPIHKHLHKGRPFYPLTRPHKSTGGRNNTGKITVRHRGGGHKRRDRLVDFFRGDPTVYSVERIEYDPNRSAHIALVKKEQSDPTVKDHKKFSYVLATEGLRAGDKIRSFRNVRNLDKIEVNDLIQRGNNVPLTHIPVGTVIHSIGIRQNDPGLFCRAAGTYARLIAKWHDSNKAIVKLKSNETRYVSLKAFATIGTVSNPEHQLESWGKAGRSRWKGIRPTVRGVAMNKCDHPHGGGRGKSKGNRKSVSPWGVLAKGYKTRRGKSVNKMKIKDRRSA